MRARKLKYAKKILAFYKSSFGFTAPHRIVIDGTFSKAALDSKINIKEHLSAYLDGDVDIYSTACGRKECELLGAILSGPLQLLRRFPEFPCDHDPPISAVNCLLSLTRQRNKHKLMLASQDAGLLEKGRERVGLPLLLLSHKSVHLERPSVKTRRAAHRQLHHQLQPSDYQHSSLLALKRSVLGEEDNSPGKKRKRKGQNPLSCRPKSKKTTGDISSQNGCSQKRRRRYRMNVAPHIRAPLKALVHKLRNEMTSQ